MVALGNGRRTAGGLSVGLRGGYEIAVQLVQVSADGVPAMARAEHVSEALALAQAATGAVDVADRDCAAEDGGRILAERVVGERDEGPPSRCRD